MAQGSFGENEAKMQEREGGEEDANNSGVRVVFTTEHDAYR